MMFLPPCIFIAMNGDYWFKVTYGAVCSVTFYALMKFSQKLDLPPAEKLSFQ